MFLSPFYSAFTLLLSFYAITLLSRFYSAFYGAKRPEQAMTGTETRCGKAVLHAVTCFYVIFMFYVTKLYGSVTGQARGVNKLPKARRCLFGAGT